MSGMSRRSLLTTTAGAAAGLAVAGCGTGKKSGGGERTGEPSGASGAHAPAKTVKLIGDGSTAYTGDQPHQPAVERLEPGQTPPQFVIFSWDGAGEVGTGLFPRFRKLAADHGVSMTFFLSGLYLLPEDKKLEYDPPNSPLGASDIGYLADDHLRMTLDNVRQAWQEGHEIGTHFNGHFCAGPGSVGRWTPADWKSEIDQARTFVTTWKTQTGWQDEDPLPFDYDKELIGARTPCLLGQDQWLPTAAALGFRYDASSPGGNQIWPAKKQGLWDLPLQLIPFPGHSFEVLSMDYNMLANQSHAATSSDPRNYPYWREQATASYIAGFERAYQTNRAPYYIGNHFEQWNGGIYMDAVENAFKYIATAGHDDVRIVSFRQFVDWLDAQDPAVLDRLRRLEVGQAPSQGWKDFMTLPAPVPAETTSSSVPMA
ncbi:polysaccharide deacetylase family protein [Actinacidiphila paucisporea]|uniref:Secreted protein n=1 Tax=Actinacidiphila paucisporea TaxID=310782 RepID=A0A1M7PW25_9ACTN|nr:hypothetical protein [Actinacidiphila paucisporea]SHN21723.1 hypothetical protein SAMN05216499_12658 [Actinacidiphila paucisporea]